MTANAPVFIDVREPSEYARSHVKGAINIPPASLMSGARELANIAKDTHLVVYCLSGSRSNVAKHILNDLGYKNITNGINQQQVEAKFKV